MSFFSYLTLWYSHKFAQKFRTTNDETGPVADQIYEMWNFTIFAI